MGLWKRKREAEQEAQAALAAKIQADIELSAAHETRREVSQQSEKLRLINQHNHFSEGLQRSFRSKPV